MYVSETHDTWSSLKRVDYPKFLNSVACAFDAAFPNVPHIFTLRKAKDEFGRPCEPYKWALEYREDVVRLDPTTRGVNGFQRFNVAIHLAPLNPTKSDYKFYKDYFGMDSADVKWSISYEAQYQFASRTSVRNFDSTERVTIIVLDRKSAMALHDLFGEASAGEPEFFDIGMPELHCEKKTPLSPRDRKAISRKAIKARENEKASEFQYDDFNIRLWHRADDKHPVESRASWSELVSFMQGSSQTLALESKSECPHFREGFFIDPLNHKLVGNIQTSKLIQLDIDSATRDPSELSAFLKINRLSHLMVNSFNSTPEKPRFHLLIPIDIAVCADDYHKIFKLLHADIVQKFGDAFEIDGSFKSINKKISMPCVSKYDGNILICETVSQNSIISEPAFLISSWYLNRVQIADQSVAGTNCNTHHGTLDHGDIEAIIEKWAVGPGVGKGGHHFYQAGLELKTALRIQCDCSDFGCKSKQIW